MSTFAKSVSIPRPSFAFNLSRNRGCLRAERSMIASRYNYMARMKRLSAMAGREVTRRREELRARHPELCDSAVWRMPSANLYGSVSLQQVERGDESYCRLASVRHHQDRLRCGVVDLGLDSSYSCTGHVQSSALHGVHDRHVEASPFARV